MFLSWFYMNCCSEGHSRLQLKVLSSSCAELECFLPYNALNYRGILFGETQPCGVPDLLSWEDLILATSLNHFYELLHVRLQRTCCELQACFSSESPLLQCQVRHCSDMCQSSSLPYSDPSQAKHTSCCFQCPMFSSGFVEKHFVEDKIIPFGFPILAQAATPTDHCTLFPQK